MSNYLHDYHILGLKPDCSLADLKAARRRLVKSWHPDRFPAGSVEKHQAEEHIKDINTAFDRLTAHHAIYGELPRATATARRGPSVIVVDPAPDQESQRAQDSSTSPRTTEDGAADDNHKSPWRYRSLRWAVGLLAAALIAEIVRTGLFESPTYTPSAAGPTPVPGETRAPPASERSTRPSHGQEYFTIGSTLGDVYAIQGVPTGTENGIWHYGKSKVFFANGAVTSWEHDPADPLKATVLPEGTKSVAPVFTLGSTKAEVRAIQGAPLTESDTLWDYGLSKVYFQDGRVTGWDSSPMHPLRARK